MDERHACPVCGTPDMFEEENSFDICSVCGWEDDRYQIRHPDDNGANNMTLIEAREAYKRGEKVS